MAERIQVELVDDIDGSEAQQTVTFAMDGVSYEIDLSEQNARNLRELFGPYIRQARTAQQQNNNRRQSRKQEREERKVRQANRKLTEEIRGAARRSHERYQQDRQEQGSDRSEPTSQSDQFDQSGQSGQLDQETLLEHPLSFTPDDSRRGAGGQALSGDGEETEESRFPAVSLPQFSSANE
ncbi:Lsr2 protein [Actinopolyspora mzabensis]|uniref:Lsr2 protein n=2 Tax=Actinopolyspora mzabensis TaxID=995066 RepID=A0A1G9FKU0_ACTMZ|nr:Lsr2 family protein [Actinopolyspora mzabensis]SDK89004.1 Lsr2 protein [Actinopolyspora mzabensis]